MFATRPSPLWGYSAVYLMELDVQPVRSGWLSAVLPVMQEAARDQVWVVGGTYNLKCMVDPGNGKTLWQEKLERGASASQLEQGSEWWNNRHINGNAVYSSSAEFVEWVKRNWGQRRGGPEAATDRCKVEGGYDELMFLDARQQFGIPGGESRWREDSRFMDCKPVGPHKSATTMDQSRLRQAFPDAALVHSSSRAHRWSLYLQLD